MSGDVFLRTLRRIAFLDFQLERATPEERAQLAAAPVPVLAPVAQDYAAWRRSALWVAAGMAALNATFQVAGFSPLAETLPFQARQAIGVRNLDLVDSGSRLMLAAFFIGAGLVALAALAWRAPRASTLLARTGWMVGFAAPFVIAAVPFTRLMDLSHLPPGVQEQVRQGLGAALALGVFLSVGPRAVSLFPGIIRSSLAVKTLLPESSVPGWTIAVVTPLYVVFLWVLVTGVLQTQASWFLLGGLAFLTLSPLVFLVRRRALIRPQPPEEAVRVVTRTKRVAGALGAVGVVLLALFLLRRPNLDVLDLLAFLTGVLANVLVLTVVVADVLLGVLRRAHEVARELHGTPLAAALDEKLAGFTPPKPPPPLS